MDHCEYEKNGHCTLNECMYGDFLFIDDSAFDTGKHCTCDYVLPSKYIDEMVKEKKTLEVGNTIECADEDDMIEMHQELCEEGYEVDFMYSKDGESGLWLEIKKTPH